MGVDNIVPINSRMGLPRTLTPDELVVLIRELLDQGGRIVVREHAYVRMEQRDISMRQVRHVLLRGEVIRGPTWSTYQNWTFTMQADTAGQLVTVGAALDIDLMGQTVIVITVY